MTINDYRPQPGETLFISVHNGQPFLATVKGYHYDKRFSGEQFEYIRRDGRVNSTTLDNAIFFPDVPIDTKFIFVITLEEHEFMEQSEFSDLAYFFDPQTSFDYIDILMTGPVKSRRGVTEFSGYSVRVEKA